MWTWTGDRSNREPPVGLVSVDLTIEDPLPPQFFFRAIDGNRFLVVQPA